MKKLFGIIAILTLLAIPAGLYAQVEAGAGSIKLGIHLDTAYRWSQQDDDDDVMWTGYSSFNVESAILDLSGKVGDKVMWRLSDALVYPVVMGGIVHPVSTPLVLEAVIQWKVIDQLGISLGRELIPTNLANAPHVMKIEHLATLPLMLTGGFLANSAVPFLYLPTYQTGAGVALNFSGVSLTYNYYNGGLLGPAGIPGGNDMFSDYMDKEKGGNVSLGYMGEVGPGKLAARAFYFQESSDVMIPKGPGVPAGLPDSADVSGYGAGVLYNADKFFLGGEINALTWDPEDVIDDVLLDSHDDTTQCGYYLLGGVKISGIELALRFDSMDYSDLDIAKHTDNENDWIIGVNYWINDNTTLGINYAIKLPEEPEDVDLPNINELSINMEMSML